MEQAGNAGPVQQASAAVAALRQRFAAMPLKQRNWLMASVVFLVAAIAGMAWYAERPDWRVLFSGLDAKDAQQVSQELAAAGIPYEMTSDGTGVQVAAEMLDKARMEVAAKGMPQTGRLGFELFDKPNWVGSEFDEKVNYQRALEGELEHTIGTIGAVRSARVHLVLPQQSLFSGEQRLAKASVVLKLKRPSMDPEQAEAIRALVAGSVENLNEEQVTLVDADGRVSMKPRSKDAAEADIEQGMETKLVAMLEPLAGRDNVRATVKVSYSENSEERTDEIYDPTQVATFSMQKSDQNAPQTGRPQGVPGTASNSPSAAAAGGVAGSQAAAAPGTPPLLQKEAQPVYPQGTGIGQTLHQENGTYAVTKHLLHTQQGPGRIQRVTAAVVINDRAVIEGGAKTLWKARGSEEMRRLEQLAQAAVGYDAKRGDQVVMENVSFTSNLPEARASGLDRALNGAKAALSTQPGLLKTLMVGVCGILIVLLVLRPVAQQVKATLKEPLALPTGDVDRGAAVPMLIADEEVVPPEPSRLRALQPPAIFEHVSEHIRREPIQSTRLLETWIGSEEGAATS
ncbi:MAG: flagellar M-ring protein FliF [Acidobacteriaceae bacterium]|nr:flagellar M-ring protein FliF [Acidobacteriaceae bacterium]